MKKIYYKLYDSQKNLKSGPQNEIIGKSNYWAQAGGSYSDLKIKIKTSITDNSFLIGDYIKIFYNSKIYYEGYIYYLDRILSGNNEFIELSIFSIGSWITTKKINKNYSGTVHDVIRNIIADCNMTFGSTLLTYKEKTNQIFNFEGEIIENFESQTIESIGIEQALNQSISISPGEKHFLDYFKEITKATGVNFFIDMQGNIIFGATYTVHTLSVKKDLQELKIGQTNSTVANSSNLRNTIKVIVNNLYNYMDIKPLDLIRVQNVKYKIKDVVVAKVSYSDIECSIDLQNFTSFTDLIKKIGQ